MTFKSDFNAVTPSLTSAAKQTAQTKGTSLDQLAPGVVLNAALAELF